MRHLRENGIAISGGTQKRQLINTGYFHGYKGYRFFRHAGNRLPFTSYSEIYATIRYDSALKALMYGKVMFIETLGDYFVEEGEETNSEANDLPDGFSYDDKKGIIQNKDDGGSPNEEEILGDTATYGESVKEILDSGKETLDSQKKEINKYQRIIDYFKIQKNQKEFGIPDDYVRGFKLKVAEVKIAKNMMNYGIESAVKYYLENVSTKDVTYEDVYFNEQSELALYLAVAQMLSVADDNVVSKYRKEFENTRVIKLLDEVLKNERKKEKERDGKTQDKNHIKS